MSRYPLNDPPGTWDDGIPERLERHDRASESVSSVVSTFSKAMKPYDNLYSDYRLSVSVLRTCAFLIYQRAVIDKSEEWRGCAEHLFNYIIQNHPETQPAIEEFFRSIGALVEKPTDEK